MSCFLFHETNIESLHPEPTQIQSSLTPYDPSGDQNPSSHLGSESMSDMDIGVFLNDSEEQPEENLWRPGSISEPGELGAVEGLQVDNEFQVARVNTYSDSQDAQVIVVDSDSESEVPNHQNNSSRIQVGSGIPMSPFLLRLSMAMERELDFFFNSSNVEDFDHIDPDYEAYLSRIENFDGMDSDYMEFLSRTSFLGYDDGDVGERNEIADMGSYPAAAAKSVVEGLVEVKIGKEKSGSCCAVCNEEFVEEQKVKELPCLHHYHGDCIVQWLRIRNTCPLCRYELPTEDEEYERRRKRRRRRRRRSQGGSASAAVGGSRGDSGSS